MLSLEIHCTDTSDTPMKSMDSLWTIRATYYEFSVHFYVHEKSINCCFHQLVASFKKELHFSFN